MMQKLIFIPSNNSISHVIVGNVERERERERERSKSYITISSGCSLYHPSDHHLPTLYYYSFSCGFISHYSSVISPSRKLVLNYPSSISFSNNLMSFCSRAISVCSSLISFSSGIISYSGSLISFYGKMMSFCSNMISDYSNIISFSSDITSSSKSSISYHYISLEEKHYKHYNHFNLINKKQKLN